jgi:hypothetical protein
MRRRVTLLCGWVSALVALGAVACSTDYSSDPSATGDASAFDGTVADGSGGGGGDDAASSSDTGGEDAGAGNDASSQHDGSTGDAATIEAGCGPVDTSLAKLACASGANQIPCASTSAGAVCVQQGTCPASSYAFFCLSPCKAPARPCCVHGAATAATACGVTIAVIDPSMGKPESECLNQCGSGDYQACASNADCPAAAPGCVPMTGVGVANASIVGNPILNVCLP